jgi:hypothetical protein
MILTNGWKSKKKQGGKYILKARIGVLTLLDFYWDRPKKQIGFTLFNYGVKNGTPLNKERP